KICWRSMQRTEVSGWLDEVVLLRRVERDCPIQFSREPRDPYVVLGPARAEMDELDIDDAVSQNRKADAFLHRTLVDDRHLISGRIREDPRRRSRRAADRAQVGEVDAILPECLPVVGGKVFADK